MAVLTDILVWSVDRPAWQRDALRRIVTKKSLTEQDVKELCRICLAQRGVTEPENPASDPNPLATEHLPSNGEQVNRVQLIGLLNIHGVNALAADQQMSFELDGLTIVFGYNVGEDEDRAYIYVQKQNLVIDTHIEPSYVSEL